MSNASSGNLIGPQLHEFKPQPPPANPISQAYHPIPIVQPGDTIVKRLVVFHQPRPFLGYSFAKQEPGLETTSTALSGPRGWQYRLAPSSMNDYGPSVTCSSARPHPNEWVIPTIPESDVLAPAPIQRRSEVESTPAFDDDSVLEYRDPGSSVGPTPAFDDDILNSTLEYDDDTLKSILEHLDPGSSVGSTPAFDEDIVNSVLECMDSSSSVGSTSAFDDSFNSTLEYNDDTLNSTLEHLDPDSSVGSTPAFDGSTNNLLALLNPDSHPVHLGEKGPSPGTEVSTDETCPRRIAALPKSKFPPPQTPFYAQHLLPAPNGGAIMGHAEYPSQVNTSPAEPSSTLGKRKTSDSSQNPKTKRARRQERENIQILPIADDQGRIICRWSGCGGRFNTWEELRKHCMGARSRESKHKIPSGKGIKTVCPYCGDNVSAVWRHVMEKHFRISRSS